MTRFIADLDSVTEKGRTQIKVLKHSEIFSDYDNLYIVRFSFDVFVAQSPMSHLAMNIDPPLV